MFHDVWIYSILQNDSKSLVIKTNAKISFTKCTVWDTRFSFISAAQDRDGRKELKVEKIGQRFLICMRYILKISKF